MFRPVRGTVDLLGAQIAKRKHIETRLCGAAELCGFSPVETPLLEHFTLFHRTLGQSSEVVSKEMFRLQQQNGSEEDAALVLRPENTASIVRAVLHANLQHELPLHYYYFGPQFRYERPQRGRQRQFTQFGTESFGKNTLESDVESIASAHFILQQILGREHKLKLKVNTLGTSEQERAGFINHLYKHLEANTGKLSPDTRRRMAEGRILRVLDSKDEADIQIVDSGPRLLDFLPQSEVERLHATMHQLREAHGMMNVELDHKLVRGLDYYSQICFEFVSEELNLTVCAGGRYDGLAKSLGHSTNLPAIGWACGVERLELLLPEVKQARIGLLLVPLYANQAQVDAEIQTRIASLASEARRLGISARVYTGGVGEKHALKKALKEAEGAARFACFIGEQEARENMVQLRDVAAATVERHALHASNAWLARVKA